jgi:phosphomannomutase
LFEDEIFKMHGKKCETHVFDPAKKWERKGDIEAKNIHYHPWGLLSTYDRDNKSKVWPAGHGGAFKTLPEILKDLGHEDRTIDVLKIDCEGCGTSNMVQRCSL